MISLDYSMLQQLKISRSRLATTDMPARQLKVEISSGVTLEKELRSPDGAGHTLTMTIGTKGPIGLAQERA